MTRRLFLVSVISFLRYYLRIETICDVFGYIGPYDNAIVQVLRKKIVNSIKSLEYHTKEIIITRSLLTHTLC